MKKYSTGLEIKKKIIRALKDKPLSLRRLETKLNVGYNPIKMHCQELEFLGIVKLIKHKRNDKNGRPYTIVSLTDYGKNI